MNIQSPQPAQSKVPHYFLGVGVGLIPLVPTLLVFVLTMYPYVDSPLSPLAHHIPDLLLLALGLYVIEIIATFITLHHQSVRSIGSGLLTMVLISPLALVIGVMILMPSSIRSVLAPCFVGVIIFYLICCSAVIYNHLQKQ